MRCENDDARSMILYSTFGGFRKGTRIVLFDNPGGATSDDWFELTFKFDMSSIRYVISTFEEGFEDRFIKAVYQRHNGLDGKVSRLEFTVPE